MITVTGRTFEHRELLKSMHGQWSNTSKSWEFYGLTQAQISQLRGLIGVQVTTAEPPKRDNLDEILERWRRRDDNAPRRPTVIYGDDQRYLNYFADKDPTAFFGFSSLAKFTDYVAALKPITGDDRRSHAWTETEERAKFTGTASMAEALHIARNGWSDGIGLIDKFHIPHAVAKHRQRAIAGGVVNIGRLLAGNPAHMTKRHKLPGSRMITLFIETIMWMGIKPYNALIRALLITGIVDVLESEGYSCEIVAVVSTTSGSGRTGHQAAITLKNAGERLNLSDVSFAFGHPSFLRRMIFATVCASDACSTTWESQGSIADSFDDDNPCRKNEFYIEQLTGFAQRALTDDPLSMLPFIEPDNFPITIRT